MMSRGALQPILTWAQDRATQRCDSSADPGAESEERAVVQYAAVRPSPLRNWHQCDKPSRHDAATFLAGGPSPLANAERSKFQFTVNQHTMMSSNCRTRGVHSASGMLGSKIRMARFDQQLLGQFALGY